MQALGALADRCVEVIRLGDRVSLCALCRENFAIRRRLYGDRVVGDTNIKLVQLAIDYGMAAKFTGSGGAILCLPDEPLPDGFEGVDGGYFDEVKEREVAAAFARLNYEFVRIQIPTQADYRS